MQQIEINNELIDIVVKDIKNSKSIKIYIKNNNIYVTKPKWVSTKKVYNMILENKNKIYDMYKKSKYDGINKILNSEIEILYFGKTMYLKLVNSNIKTTLVEIKDNNIMVHVNSNLDDKEKILQIKRNLINFFRNKLKLILDDRIKYYSDKLKLKYSTYSIKSMCTRFGSCNTKTKKLNFNVNLCFMPEDVIDSIIVHELCHIKYKNHGKDFYDMVYKCFPKYNMCKKWIKSNDNYLRLLY